MVADFLLGMCLALADDWTNTSSHSELNKSARFQSGFRPSMWTADIRSGTECVAVFCSPPSAPGELSNGGRVLLVLPQGGLECPWKKGELVEVARNNDFKPPQPTLFRLVEPSSIQAVREQLVEMESEGNITVVQTDATASVVASVSFSEVPNESIFSGPFEDVEPASGISVFTESMPLTLPSLLLAGDHDVTVMYTAFSLAQDNSLDLSDLRLAALIEEQFIFSTSDKVMEISEGGMKVVFSRDTPTDQSLQSELSTVGCILAKNGNLAAGRLVSLSFLMDPSLPPLDQVSCRAVSR